MFPNFRLILLASVAVVLVGCTETGGLALGAGSADPMARPEVARSLLDAAEAADAASDPATAAGYYRNVYARDPANTRAAVGLLASLRKAGALDQAREAADKILPQARDPQLLAEIGKVRLVSGQLQDAVKLLQRAADADPADWKSRSALGVAYDRLGDHAQAEANYRAALAISPDNSAVLNNFALSRAMANDLSFARDLLQRAVTGVASDIRTRQNLAIVYALSGDMEHAEALTIRDLPPDLARDTLAYYRKLASEAR